MLFYLVKLKQIYFFMKKFSVEILPRQKSKIFELSNDFFEDIYITHIPGSPSDELVQTSELILNEGFNPVPHIPARSFSSDDDAFILLKSLNNIGVNTLLTIGGSTKDASGPFASTMDMYQSGIFNTLDFDEIRLAGHPEGNPDDTNSDFSLLNKLKWLNDINVKISIVTQFCLSYEITNRWIIETNKLIKDNNFNADLSIGIAGPAKISTLIKYAKVCGVSASKNFLMRQGFDITKLLKLDPNAIIQYLKGYDNLHFFPFGGINELSKWVKENNFNFKNKEL